MEYWNPAIECIKEEKLKEIQIKRLKDTVNKIYENVPYYAKKMDDLGIDPHDIVSLADLKKLPFTNKEDLRITYPFGMFATPMEDIVRIHASSGTTGKQTVVGYTKDDIRTWSENMARCLVMAGVSKASKVQICYGYGLFTGGLGVHYGVELVGAAAVPASTGNTERQINMLKDFQSTCLCCTPSYALYIADTLNKAGIKKNELHLTSGIFGAEPWTEEMRREIEERLGIKAYDIYGLSEIMGPSIAQECECQNGLHIWEDNFIPEIIDVETEEVLEDGKLGNLVITTINKQGLPLIRYKTGDICSLSHEKCNCGRTHARLTKLKGRTDDMLIIRGVNIFPTQIESALLNFSETSPYYQIIVDRVHNLDRLTVDFELFDEEIFGNEDEQRKIKNSISKKIESVIGIAVNINILKANSIQRYEGKARRVVDNRMMSL